VEISNVARFEVQYFHTLEGLGKTTANFSVRIASLQAENSTSDLSNTKHECLLIDYDVQFKLLKHNVFLCDKPLLDTMLGNNYYI
jgi:predicted subunit of tRNA(5-methylaminomethyl-2-thiouridylate) methyltransferase